MGADSEREEALWGGSRHTNVMSLPLLFLQNNWLNNCVQMREDGGGAGGGGDKEDRVVSRLTVFGTSEGGGQVAVFQRKQWTKRFNNNTLFPFRVC